MKKRILLIGIILGSTIFLLILPSTKAAKYSYNVETGNDKNGMQYIYEIKSWDKDAAEDIFGTDNIEDVLGDGAKIGSMQCINLYDADSSHKGWDIDGFRWTGKWGDYGEPEDVWVEDKKEFNDIDVKYGERYQDGELIIYKDPEDWGEDINVDDSFLIILKLTMGVPSPVEEYLKSIDWHVGGLSISEFALSFKYDKDDSNFEEDIWIEYKWDANGLYQGQKWTEDDKDKTVIFEIGLQKAIPEYAIPICLGILGITIIGIIAIIIRKRKSEIKSTK